MRSDLPILLDGLLDAFWPDGDAGAWLIPGTMGHTRLADVVADGGPTARLRETLPPDVWIRRSAKCRRAAACEGTPNATPTAAVARNDQPSGGMSWTCSRPALACMPALINVLTDPSVASPRRAYLA
jgi:hypothetical protein